MRYKWLPVINPDICNGCQECVLACGPRCLKIVDNLAVLTNLDICGSEEHCIGPCPVQAIKMAWVPMQGNQLVGKWK
jgi:NAD-dependent dihydropyrimidine dehydrogenase PreA subunit